jgi:hypothetical protein
MTKTAMTSYTGICFFFLSSLATVFGQLCDTEVSTWIELVEAIDQNAGIVFLCPFTIQGEGCSSDTGGLQVKPNNHIELLCEPSFSAASGQPGCVIDCPGTHFDIFANGSLLLDGITLRGSTNSAVRIQSRGSFVTYNAIFEK